ncbi:mitochondrial ribosomal protein L23 [Lasioglossum baleicum]|uniref:mitochondrial ribosomal protein L23 n=1 Tax=Lasioglossum baleicum TaxID=434251 RepID=UPI003FCCBD28
MSTRWYPLYQMGNPQLRVFLPNFWMKLVQCKNQPENVVQFHCSMEMTKIDIQNYLEKIYNVFPAHVRTAINLGEMRRCRNTGAVLKDDDIKVAYVSLKKGDKFTFPDLFPPSEETTDEEAHRKESEEEYKKFVKSNQMPGLPTWFRM